MPLPMANFTVVPRSRGPVTSASRRTSVAIRVGATLVVGALALVVRVDGAVAQVAGGAEAEFAARVTAERQAQGRPALPMEDDLVAVARNHSAAMASAARRYHNTLLGQQVQGWQLVAENVGMGSSVDQVHQALMASPQHRADILNARFDGIGIGVVQSGGSMWVTEVFRQRADAAAVASGPPAPTPEPTTEPPTPAPAPPPAPPRRPAPPAPSRAPLPTTTAAPTTSTSTTTTSTSTTTTSGPALVTASVEIPLDLDGLATSSIPVPSPRPDLVAAGTVAAALLWMVSAGMVRLGIRTRFAYGR